uniref:Uncharacterized protein n=1 Tax=Arundo donax TaxID=35708 RepID=A0A0A9AMD3_ARUDO
MFLLILMPCRFRRRSWNGT